MNCKIEMATRHRLSLLFIILISGFKLGLTTPVDGIKGNYSVQAVFKNNYVEKTAENSDLICTLSHFFWTTIFGIYNG